MLYHTTGDPDFLIRPDFFEFAGDFILSFLSDGAGIENNDIGILDIFCIRKSAVAQHRLNSCTIGIIHLTAEN